MNSERMSFDEACRELGVTEAELENLVAAGEIASLKEGDTLYFKKEVVRKFKKSRDSEPTILLADEELSGRVHPLRIDRFTHPAHVVSTDRGTQRTIEDVIAVAACLRAVASMEALAYFACP